MPKKRHVSEIAVGAPLCVRPFESPVELGDPHTYLLNSFSAELFLFFFHESQRSDVEQIKPEYAYPGIHVTVRATLWRVFRVFLDLIGRAAVGRGGGEYFVAISTVK